MSRISLIWTKLLEAAPPRFWAAAGAALFLSGFRIWYTVIVAYGNWPTRLDGDRLHNLFLNSMADQVILGIIIVFFTATHFRGGGPAGLSLDIGGGGDQQPRATVTTTTEVKGDVRTS